MNRLGKVLLALAIVETLGAVWWWALVGMSRDMGIAHGVTVWVFVQTAIPLVWWEVKK